MPSRSHDPATTLALLKLDSVVGVKGLFDKGGRLEFLLELVASGATQEQILARYSQLAPDGLAAAFQYAANALKGEHTWELRITA